MSLHSEPATPNRPRTPESLPPSYLSGEAPSSLFSGLEDPVLPYEPLPDYRAQPPPPKYDPLPTPSEEDIRAFMESRFPGTIQGGQLGNLYVQPLQQHEQIEPKRWPRWLRIITTLCIFLTSAVGLVLPITMLFASPVSSINEPYLYELNNIDLNLSTFAHHVNLNEIKASATELISVPDFIRVGLEEYCTDDDPFFSSGRCASYHSWNHQGSLEHIYSILVTEAVGKKLSLETVALPSPDILQKSVATREWIKTTLCWCAMVHFVALPCLSMVSIIETGLSNTDVMMVKVLTASGICTVALSFSIASTYLLESLINSLNEAFKNEFDTFGVTVKAGRTFRAFCFATSIIDGIFFIIGCVCATIYFQTQIKGFFRKWLRRN